MSKTQSKTETTSPTRGALEPFREAHCSYWRAAQEVQTEVQKLNCETQAKYIQSLQAVHLDAQNRAIEAQAKYVQALQEAKGDAQQAQVAYKNLVQTCQSIQLDMKTRCEEAHRNYLKALKDAQETVKKHFNHVYTKYVTDLREAWANVDVKDLEPWPLSVIGWNTAAAGLFASGPECAFQTCGHNEDSQ